jgi:hypothetical protein
MAALRHPNVLVRGFCAWARLGLTGSRHLKMAVLPLGAATTSRSQAGAHYAALQAHPMPMMRLLCAACVRVCLCHLRRACPAVLDFRCCMPLPPGALPGPLPCQASLLALHAGVAWRCLAHRPAIFTFRRHARLMLPCGFCFQCRMRPLARRCLAALPWLGSGAGRCRRCSALLRLALPC